MSDGKTLTSKTRKPCCPAASARWTIARRLDWSGCATGPPQSCDCARARALGTARRCRVSPLRFYRESESAYSCPVFPANLQHNGARLVRRIPCCSSQRYERQIDRSGINESSKGSRVTQPRVFSEIRKIITSLSRSRKRLACKARFRQSIIRDRIQDRDLSIISCNEKCLKNPETSTYK